MMLTAKTVRGLADRLAKAEALVAAGAVSAVENLDGYYVVLNGDGTKHYLVRIDAGHEHCTCPDFTERQGPAGLPCKHLLSAQIVAATPKTRPVEEPVTTPAPTPIDGKLALARLQAADADDPWGTAAD